MSISPFLCAVLVASAALHAADAAYMPIEGDPQQSVLMSLPTRADVWGVDELPAVQAAVMRLANTIAAFVQVIVYVSPPDVLIAQRRAVNANVTIHAFQVDDLWMRDTACVFAYAECNSHNDCTSKHGVDASRWPLQCVGFNFNGWGNRQAHAADARVAAEVAQRTRATFVHSSLVLEGGGLEVDGAGTAIATESSILNINRNPAGLTKQEVGVELLRVLGIRKVIWTPGVKGKDITDAHIDFYARFVRPGVVVAAREEDPTHFDYDVSRRVIADLRAATDADGNALTVHVIPNPSTVRTEWASDKFASSYINYLVTNGAVVVPNFGDSVADAVAAATLRQLYPDRTVVMTNEDPIAFGGGGIHCATKEIPVGATSHAVPTPAPVPRPAVSAGGRALMSPVLAIALAIVGLIGL